MKPSPHPASSHPADKLVLQGIHVDITDAFRTIALEKTSRLFGRSSEIVRIRIDLERQQTEDVSDRFLAKGQIEIRGPDLIASATAADAYSSLDELVDKLDRLLSRRHGVRKDDRNHPHATDLDVPLPKGD